MPAAKVTVATVTEKKVIEWREFTGRTEAVETVEVRPRVSGHIQEVRFQSGQLVKKGDVLFVIDPRWHQAEFDRREAEYVQAKVRLETAEREANRTGQLLTSKAISTEEAETRQSRFSEAKAVLLAAEAARNFAKLDLDLTGLAVGAPEYRRGSTGRGEANLYNLSSYLIVEEMRRGAHPKDAIAEALRRIRARSIERRLLKADGTPNFDVKFYALNAAGEHAAAGIAAEIGLDQGAGDPGERDAFDGQREPRHQPDQRLDLAIVEALRMIGRPGGIDAIHLADRGAHLVAGHGDHQHVVRDLPRAVGLAAVRGVQFASLAGSMKCCSTAESLVDVKS
jgi:hypothetical protein